MAARIFRRLRDLLDVDAANIGDGKVPVFRSASGKHEYETPEGVGGGAPTTADYLVGTSNGSLSSEIVVGTSPGGELGGTWASPTVDATHSGSSHAGVQAAAEATAAAALSSHAADTTGVHGIPDTSALETTAGAQAKVDAAVTALINAAPGALDTLDELAAALGDDANFAATVTSALAGKAAASHVHAGEDITSGTVADARIASSIARDSEVSSAIAALSSVYQAKDTSLDYFAGLDPAANVKTILEAADYAAIRTALSLVPGSDVQAHAALLDTLVGLAANKFVARSSSGAAAAKDITDAALALLDDADAAAQRVTLGAAPNGQALFPTGAIQTTFPRHMVVAAANALQAQRLTLVAIDLPKGVTITSISFLSGTNALASGTHQIFGLYDDAAGSSSGTPYALLRGTNDDTSTAWGSNTVKTLNLTSTYPTTRSGLFYLGILVDIGGGGTLPQLVGPGGSSLTAFFQLAPVFYGHSSTGVTALPNPAAAPTTAASLPVFAYVS